MGTQIDKSELSWDDWDELNDPRPEETEFDKIVETAISRRGFLGGLMAFGSGAAVMGTGVLSSTASAQAQNVSMERFPFKPIPIATDSTIHVPEGYSWKSLAKWGDALFQMPHNLIIRLPVTLKMQAVGLVKIPMVWNRFLSEPVSL